MTENPPSVSLLKGGDYYPAPFSTYASTDAPWSGETTLILRPTVSSKSLLDTISFAKGTAPKPPPLRRGRLQRLLHPPPLFLAEYISHFKHVSLPSNQLHGIPIRLVRRTMFRVPEPKPAVEL